FEPIPAARLGRQTVRRTRGFSIPLDAGAPRVEFGAPPTLPQIEGRGNPDAPVRRSGRPEKRLQRACGGGLPRCIGAEDDVDTGGEGLELEASVTDPRHPPDDDGPKVESAQIGSSFCASISSSSSIAARDSSARTALSLSARLTDSRT